MIDLPLVDVHSIEVAADIDTTWAALVERFERTPPPATATYARLVGCEDPTGFHVASSTRPTELVLAGRHRFSTYTLTFRLEPGTRLSAETRATFPGIGGRAYRLAVISSGAHVRLTRRLLAGIKRAAER